MFRKAAKRDAKLRLALSGPAGSGNTYSLLVDRQTHSECVARVKRAKRTANALCALNAPSAQRMRCARLNAHVRRTVWEVWKAAQEEKGTAAARAQGGWLPREGTHGD